ncbi:transglycosylase domain-containing protein, partial [Saccharomonospora iraqiensis]|uniref:transglycosylase domain-containing protein n=1 Tax=Saccharomonospora iraqiensis TaxID=52698 RepID=UPI000696EC66
GTGADDHGTGPDGHAPYGAGPDDAPGDEQRLHESGPDGDGAPASRWGRRTSKANLSPAQRKKRRWKIIRRSLYAFVGLFLVLPATAFAITYFLVEVPSPEDVAQDQAKVVTYFYSDGQTEMGRDIPVDGGNRVLLDYEQIPEVTRHAVYSAEDATFETNPGFDVSGILRAVYNQLTGGVGGGSTISQQYVKVATGDDAYSYTRKWTEIVKAFKMNNQLSKQEIITAYLNTIYLGRGAYGVQTAAQAYFDKDAQDLTASESAVLAGLIQQPGRSDDTEVLRERWTFVMNQMVSNGWLSEADRRSAEFPDIVPEERSRPNTIDGPESYIQRRAQAELAEKGYPEEKLQAGGYQVHLTIDPEAQKQATEAVNEVMEGQPEKLREALVAVDPDTGAVRAYYGGPNEPGVDEYDWASAQRNPGSSFKPFDLVALLQQGKGLGAVYDGSSPRTFGDVEVRNSGNTQCERCTVAKAMEKSINTVFYDMVLNELGPQAVAEAARAAGIPEKGSGPDARETMPAPDGNISIGGGSNVVSPTQMASAYATFASGGMRHDTHFVAKLTTSDGEVVFDETSDVATEGEPAFSGDPEKSKQIAGNVTESLEPVLPYSDLECADDRDCAGKTGTHQYESEEQTGENSEAWMVGYNPQISAAAWVGTGGHEPIRTAAGAPIYGSGLPGEIWKTFMDSYLEGKPRASFDEVELIGKPPAPPPSATDDASPSEETEESSETSETESSEPTATVPTETETTDNPNDNWPWPGNGDDEDDGGGDGDGDETQGGNGYGNDGDRVRETEDSSWW